MRAGTVRFKGGSVVHGRELTAYGPQTLCGRYGDPRGGAYDPSGRTEPTCRPCKRALLQKEEKT